MCLGVCFSSDVLMSPCLFWYVQGSIIPCFLWCVSSYVSRGPCFSDVSRSRCFFWCVQGPVLLLMCPGVCVSLDVSGVHVFYNVSRSLFFFWCVRGPCFFWCVQGSMFRLMCLGVRVFSYVFKGPWFANVSRGPCFYWCTQESMFLLMCQGVRVSIDVSKGPCFLLSVQWSVFLLIWPPAVYPSCWDGRSRGQIKHGWWMDGWNVALVVERARGSTHSYGKVQLQHGVLLSHLSVAMLNLIYHLIHNCCLVRWRIQKGGGGSDPLPFSFARKHCQI
jgi:hypothetical protein